MTSLAVFLWGPQAVCSKVGVDPYGWIDAGACNGVAAVPFSGTPAALARTFPLDLCETYPNWLGDRRSEVGSFLRNEGNRRQVSKS